MGQTFKYNHIHIPHDHITPKSKVVRYPFTVNVHKSIRKNNQKTKSTKPIVTTV